MIKFYFLASFGQEWGFNIFKLHEVFPRLCVEVIRYGVGRVSSKTAWNSCLTRAEHMAF